VAPTGFRNELINQGKKKKKKDKKTMVLRTFHGWINL
jgi:hypothetical protein